MWDLILILCYCLFSCEIHFLELLEQELIQGSFSHSTELTLLLCSYSVKKVVAAFCDFLALFHPIFIWTFFLFLSVIPTLLNFWVLSHLFLPSVGSFPGREAWSVSWVHRLCQPFPRTSVPTQYWRGKALPVCYCPQGGPSHFPVTNCGIFWSYMILDLSVALVPPFSFRYLDAGLVALGVFVDILSLSFVVYVVCGFEI